MLAQKYPDATGFDLAWLKKRFVRVISVYYPALIAMALLFPVFTYYRGPYDLALHFLFLNWLSHDTAFSIISAAWFMVPLVALYALFPFLNRLIKMDERLLMIVFLLAFANRLIDTSLISFSPIFFLAEFCFGIVLANELRNKWLFSLPMLFAIINPLMVLPFALFLLVRWIGIITVPFPIRIIAENTFEIFLFHEAAIMVALGKWDVYGQGVLVSLAILGIAIVMVKALSRKINAHISG
jgi:hypothetical protein